MAITIEFPPRIALLVEFELACYRSLGSENISSQTVRRKKLANTLSSFHILYSWRMGPRMLFDNWRLDVTIDIKKKNAKFTVE